MYITYIHLQYLSFTSRMQNILKTSNINTVLGYTSLRTFPFSYESFPYWTLLYWWCIPYFFSFLLLLLMLLYLIDEIFTYMTSDFRISKAACLACLRRVFLYNSICCEESKRKREWRVRVDVYSGRRFFRDTSVYKIIIIGNNIGSCTLKNYMNLIPLVFFQGILFVLKGEFSYTWESCTGRFLSFSMNFFPVFEFIECFVFIIDVLNWHRWYCYNIKGSIVTSILNSVSVSVSTYGVSVEYEGWTTHIYGSKISI